MAVCVATSANVAATYSYLGETISGGSVIQTLGPTVVSASVSAWGVSDSWASLSVCCRAEKCRAHGVHERVEEA